MMDARRGMGKRVNLRVCENSQIMAAEALLVYYYIDFTIDTGMTLKRTLRLKSYSSAAGMGWINKISMMG